jgi:hypothetical protein
LKSASTRSMTTSSGSIASWRFTAAPRWFAASMRPAPNYKMRRGGPRGATENHRPAPETRPLKRGLEAQCIASVSCIPDRAGARSAAF